MALSSPPFVETDPNLPEALPRITLPAPNKVTLAAVLCTGQGQQQFFALGGVQESREPIFNAEGNRGNNICLEFDLSSGSQFRGTTVHVFVTSLLGLQNKHVNVDLLSKTNLPLALKY